VSLEVGAALVDLDLGDGVVEGLDQDLRAVLVDTVDAVLASLQIRIKPVGMVGGQFARWRRDAEDGPDRIAWRVPGAGDRLRGADTARVAATPRVAPAPPRVALRVPRPVLRAVSCTAMRRPRAALKTIRWKFLFMPWPSPGAQKL
jgi:hypothetical protein